MKRWHKILVFFITLLLFVASFLWVQKVLSYRYDCGGNVVKRKQELLQLPENELDVVFLGSSGLFAGVSPARLWSSHQVTSYNLSASVQPYIVRYYNLLEILLHQKPKLLIMDISSLTSINSSPLHASYQGSYRKGFNDIHNLKLKFQYLGSLKSEYPELDVFNYVLPFFKFHTSWDTVEEQNFSYQKEYPSYWMGSLLRKSIKPVSISKKHLVNLGEAKIDVNPIHMKYFELCTELCVSHDIEMLFIITPRIKLTYSQLETIQEITDQRQIPFVNFSDPKLMEEMDLDLEHDFYDSGHLNVWGNRKFTEYLGDLIVNLYPELARENAEGCDPWVQAALEYEDYYRSVNDK